MVKAKNIFNNITLTGLIQVVSQKMVACIFLCEGFLYHELLTFELPKLAGLIAFEILTKQFEL